MNPYCIKCFKFTNDDNIKIKRKIEVKNNLYPYCIKCGLKKFETIVGEELCDLMKTWNFMQKQCYCIVLSVEKRRIINILKLQIQIKEE